jgi:hypothetical protein
LTETVTGPAYSLTDFLAPEGWLNVPDPVIDAFNHTIKYSDLTNKLIMTLNEKVNQLEEASIEARYKIHS